MSRAWAFNGIEAILEGSRKSGPMVQMAAKAAEFGGRRMGVPMDGTASAKYSPARCAAEGFLALNLPSHLSLERLISIVEILRHRRIEVDVSESLNGGSVCGVWLSTDSTEIILHAPTPSALHRQQFILHELGHMVLRHDELVVSSNYAETLFPNLSGEKVSRILGRSDFLDHIEAAAETLADLFAAAIRDSSLEPRSFERIFG